jgi:pimeloyl-ACP methyl ester carboxylesterase
MERIVQVITPEVHADPAYVEYAQALDALLAEYRMTAQPSFVDVDAAPPGTGRMKLRTFVLQCGTGTPVLFLNGTPATAAVWAPLLGSLTGVRAIVVDRPGHGLTGDFDYAGLDDVRAHAVSFLESVLDALALERVVVAGNSLGGLWGLWLAVDRPQRVTGIVQLGLPPGLLSDRLPLVFGLLSVPWIARLARRLDPPSCASTRRMFKKMGDPPASLSDTFADVFTQGQRLPNVEGGTAHLIQRFVRPPGRLHPRMWLDAAALAGVRQPVLFLAGADDFVGDLAAARRMAAAIPGAELRELGRGHLPWLQDADGAARAIQDFLHRRVGDSVDGDV